ncbi:D-alanyl-D-alanine carboxypeptidase family protein [uncultured Dialister sp.]|uniref:D-alanyl-D-alanine carboxypeptidase family protein n=1 Tax=uncultured Dialister sp. TaxID=278064 RepID=UPI0025CF975F|nr:D-alanyl-D-alanine carboxypeptidase family protein [uncultured Dialister sp.]
MKKLFTLLVLAIIFAAIGFGALVLITPDPPKAPEIPPPPEIKAVTAALLDAQTGKVLTDKEGTLRVYPASTTKILTTIIALEEGKARLEQNAKITPLAMKQDGTNLGVRQDMPISLHQMLYGMMLISGNDAAVATAETVGGNYDRFIEMMNEKAASIGVHDSHFANPSGLTNKNHYSTAIDMAKIAAYAMKNPDFRDIVKRKTYPMTYRNGMFRNVENRNEFLSSGYEGANGVKTGMTEAAGDCLVASAERNGRLLIVSLYNDKNRWNDTKAWLDYGWTVIAMEDQYKAALAAEDPIYKFINRILGKEPKEQDA